MRLLVLLCALLSATLAYNQTTDEMAIHECFNGYAEAVYSGKILPWLDSASINHLESLLHLVKTADSTTIVALPLHKQWDILLARLTLPRDTILTVDLAGYLERPQDQQPQPAQRRTRMEIDSIGVNGDHALANYGQSDGAKATHDAIDIRNR